MPKATLLALQLAAAFAPFLAIHAYDVHYDSSRFSPIGDNNGVAGMLGYTPTNLLVNTVIVADGDDRDKDPITDRAIRLSWINTSQDFPGTELPAELGTLNFQNGGLLCVLRRGF